MPDGSCYIPCYHRGYNKLLDIKLTMMNQAVVVIAFNPGRGRWISVRSKLAWSTDLVLGESGLHHTHKPCLRKTKHFFFN